jgi:hypothetical protein
MTVLFTVICGAMSSLVIVQLIVSPSSRSLSDLGCDVARYSLGIKKNDAGAVEFAHRTNCGAENSFS